ncbi:MAG: hypothetical protein GY866_08125 [Proteobacteria bacterium]|nr:hypothetical protein [Pseudomonadota bacterium]
MECEKEGQANNTLIILEYQKKKKQLKVYAREFILNDGWYITTCGWPWVTTFTSGETAYTRLEWTKK